MARLTPGYNFTTNEALTATKLHELVDDSYLVGVTQADMNSGVRPINTSTPASPAAGDVRVGSTGLLEFYYSSAWQVQDPDIQSATFTNKSGVDLPLGAVVVPDPANDGSFIRATGARTYNVLGVLAAAIANNASGLVYLRGRVQALCANFVAGGIAAIVGGYPLRGPDGTSVIAEFKYCFQLVSLDPAAVTSDHYGVSLQSCPAEDGDGNLIYVKLGRK